MRPGAFGYGFPKRAHSLRGAVGCRTWRMAFVGSGSSSAARRLAPSDRVVEVA